MWNLKYWMELTSSRSLGQGKHKTSLNGLWCLYNWPMKYCSRAAGSSWATLQAYIWGSLICHLVPPNSTRRIVMLLNSDIDGLVCRIWVAVRDFFWNWWMWLWKGIGLVVLCRSGCGMNWLWVRWRWRMFWRKKIRWEARKCRVRGGRDSKKAILYTTFKF